MKHRILSIILVATLWVGLVVPGSPSAAAFSDIGNPNLEEAVAVLSALGIVDGYADGDYHPQDALTRAQFCKLMITAMGKGDQAAISGYRTLFSDLGSSHWAAGYVNLAYDQGLISGYGNGTFGPEDPVDLSQAVTMVLKALGYTTDDIGPFWPEDYLRKAKELELTEETQGLEVLTRGDAALLLYAMLKAETAQGKVFAHTLAAQTVSSALLLSQNAQASDGTPDVAQVYAGGTVSYYRQEDTLPTALVGRRGTLLLNGAGRVMGLLPEEQTGKTVEVEDVTARGITAPDGSTYALSGTLPVVLKGEKTTFDQAWYSMGNLGVVTLYYNASGSVDLLWAGAADTGEKAYVVTVTAGQETLLKSVFSVTGSVSVKKNGQTADFEDIAPYDVVTYDEVSKTFLVSDRRVSGHLENVRPNTQAPIAATVLGAEFSVLDCGQESLSAFSAGERLTLLLTVDGSVAAAYPVATVKGENIGIYDGTAVTLADGTKLSGTLNGGDTLQGSVVKVSSSAIGKLTLSAVAGTTVSGSLNVDTNTLGKYNLAPGLVIFDQISGGAAIQLSLSDLKRSTISAGQISSAILNGAGQVAYLFLEDATGDCYTYGTMVTKKVTDGSADDGTEYSYQTVAVTNGEGVGQYYAYVSGVKTVGGLAVLGNGKTVKAVDLTRETVSRSDIILEKDGDSYVTAGGQVWPISAEVQVYNSQTKQWCTLEEAMAFWDSFSVYYDRPVTQGGQIRVIYI